MFKKLTMTLAASALAFGANAAAQGDEQPPYEPRVAPQAAGAFGPVTMWAFINADGTHASDAGLGLQSSQNFSTGTYEVIFQRVVGNCIYVPTMAQRSTSTTEGFVYAVRRSGNNRGVFLQTYDTTGALADRNFSLLVSCYK